MSESKQNQINEQKLQKKSSHIKRVSIIVITVLIIPSVMAFLWYFGLNNSSTKNEQIKLLEKTQNSFNNYNEASKLVLTKGYEAGQAMLDGLIKNVNNNVDKADLYIQKATIAINSNKYDDAYNFAKNAEDLDPSISSAQTMAVAASKKGDNQDAIIKYKLALSRIIGTAEMDELDRQDIRNAIVNLGG